MSSRSWSPVTRIATADSASASKVVVAGEQVQAEIAAQRFLDDLAVGLPLTGGAYLDPAENVLVEGGGGAHL